MMLKGTPVFAQIFIRPIVRTANIVIRLLEYVLNAISYIADEEHPIISLQLLKINFSGVKTVDEVLAVTRDCVS